MDTDLSRDPLREWRDGRNKKRRIHSAQFKANAGMEVMRGVETVSEIGQRYEVQPVANQRKKELGGHAATLFKVKRGPRKAIWGAGQKCLYGEKRATEDKARLTQKKSGL